MRKLLINTGGWKEGLRVGLQVDSSCKSAICAETSPFIHYILENIPKPVETVIVISVLFFSFPTIFPLQWRGQLQAKRGDWFLCASKEAFLLLTLLVPGRSPTQVISSRLECKNSFTAASWLLNIFSLWSYWRFSHCEQIFSTLKRNVFVTAFLLLILVLRSCRSESV